MAHLIKIGFDPEAADKVFESINLPPPAEIDGKIADLQALGFADPVKMITSSPALLGYSRKRLNQCAAIVRRLVDASDSKLAQLICKRQAVIDAVDAADCRCWRDVREIITKSKRGHE